MKITDLKPKTGKVDIVLEITEKGEPKEFAKFGSKGKVCNAKGKDESGVIAITLWNEQIDLVKVGDQVQISNGYVSEYQGEMQLSTGKFGQLTVLGKDKAGKSSSKPSAKQETDDESDSDSEDDEDGPEGELGDEGFGGDEQVDEEAGDFDEEFIE